MTTKDHLVYRRQTVTCVCLLMRLEDARGDKTTPTEFALVRFLPRVWAHMLLQVAGLLEAFVAIVTSRNKTQRTQALFTQEYDCWVAGHLAIEGSKVALACSPSWSVFLAKPQHCSILKAQSRQYKAEVRTLIVGSSSVQDICNLKCIILKLVNAVTPQETI